MRVIVTGARGRLGTILAPHLLDRGYDVLGIDAPGSVLRPESDRPLRTVATVDVDLRDEDATKATIHDADAIVHLANHPGPNRGTAQTVFNENVSMDMNVFQSAVDAGIEKIVFASSAQVYQGKLTTREEVRRHLPAVPIDAGLPPSPRNPYGLSKLAGETMLEYFCNTYAVSGVSLRLPALLALSSPERSRREFPWMRTGGDAYELRDPSPGRARQGEPNLAWIWSLMGLSRAEAARLIDAILCADLPGHRPYLPSAGTPVSLELSEFFREYIPDVSLRVSPEELDEHGVCDVSTISAETGWQPIER